MNASRGTARKASRMSGSVIPRRLSCRSTIASRSDAKSVMDRPLKVNQWTRERVPMGGSDTVFAGSIPAIYDRYLVPLLFRPYAQVAADRAQSLEPGRILETAAGTGVLTEALHAALPAAEIIATDL